MASSSARSGSRPSIGNTRPTARPQQHFLVPPTSTNRVWTLAQISRLTGASVAKLQQLNPQITHANFILPGQSVRYA